MNLRRCSVEIFLSGSHFLGWENPGELDRSVPQRLPLATSDLKKVSQFHVNAKISRTVDISVVSRLKQ